MPFDVNGVYTPPVGAENAAAGQLIRSTTWNSIFTDIAAALTQLGQGAWVATPRVISAPGSIAVGPTDSTILIEANVPTITLPLSATKQGPVKILGAVVGVFSSANALLVPTSPETISGQPSITLNVDYQVIVLYPLASGGYLFD